MNILKNKRLYLIGGAALAALVAVVVLLIALGGGSGRYEKHYDAAEAAFLRKDYGTALSELDKALNIRETEEGYLLMADVYYAQGDADGAIQALLLGYSHVGGDVIPAMMERLNSAPESMAPRPASIVAVGGRTFSLDTSSVVLSGKGLGNSDLETLCALTGLENLSISDNAISDIAPIAGLEKLTSLQISNNNVSDLSPLSGLASLKTLYLDGNPVGDLTPLYQLKNLRTLSMKDVELSGSELQALEDALPGCYIVSEKRENAAEQITLGGAVFSADVTELSLCSLKLDDLTELAKCKNLVKLDLRDNEISDLSPLVELRSLEWLRLWNNKVTDLTPLMSLSHLKFLDADNNRITSVKVLEYLPELEELCLNNNALSSFDVLGKLNGLKRLELKNTGIGDGDLGLLYGLTDLEELALEDNDGLSGETVDKLREALPDCDITHSALLWTIELGGETYTSDAAEISAAGKGIRDLSGLEHFENLARLELDGNDITDLSPLFGLEKLRALSLRENPRLTAEAVEELRAKLPDCEILFEPEEPEPDEEPAPSDDPELATDPAYSAKGAQAAIDGAGTGSGYAILRLDGDAAGAGIREGFLSAAVEMGMNVVWDGAAPAGAESFAEALGEMRSGGADVVFLAVDNWTYAEIVSQAETVGYSPKFVQVY